MRKHLWLALLALGACDGTGILDAGTVDAAPADAGEPSDAGRDASRLDASSGSDASVTDAGSFEVPDVGTGIVLPLSLARIEPAVGPYTGGVTVLVRGTGFDASAWGPSCTACGSLSFGGVAATSVTFVDDHRLRATVPAGDPGPVDVAITQGTASASLAAGFTYQALAVTPPMGSVGGGTLVTIEGTGTAFADGDTVVLGGATCEAIVVESPTRLSCRTTAHADGVVDVVVNGAGGAVVAQGAFAYVDPIVARGGFDGGPIEGTIDVVILDSYTNMAVAGVFVALGEDPAPLHQGTTDAAGRITFSSAALAGPLNLHAAKRCYETTSVVGLDSARVTLLLTPLYDPACPPVGSSGGGHGRSGVFIGGELIWTGVGSGPHPWSNVPAPSSEEERVAYVFTSRQAANYPNPDPSTGGVMHRVTESGAGSRGYPYEIFARPGTLAVYALAGIEDRATGAFTPSVMGIVRGVVTRPSDVLRDVDIAMDILLDRSLEVRLEELPAIDAPRVVSAHLVVDDGAIVRELPGGVELDTVRSETETTFVLPMQPSLTGALAGAHYEVSASLGDIYDDARTTRRLPRVTDVDAPIVVDGFLDVATAIAPAPGGTLPPDRVLRWSADAPSAALVHVLVSQGYLSWRIIAPGTTREVPLVDLSSLADVDDLVTGPFTWFVLARTVPGTRFDTFRYEHLSARATHESSTYFQATR